MWGRLTPRSFASTATLLLPLHNFYFHFTTLLRNTALPSFRASKSQHCFIISCHHLMHIPCTFTNANIRQPRARKSAPNFCHLADIISRAMHFYMTSATEKLSQSFLTCGPLTDTVGYTAAQYSAYVPNDAHPSIHYVMRISPILRQCNTDVILAHATCRKTTMKHRMFEPRRNLRLFSFPG